MYAWLVAGAILIALVALSVMLNRRLASLRCGVPNDLPEQDAPRPTAREGAPNHLQRTTRRRAS
jgi:hypothetical protein